jgi:hypothetical protein
MREQQTGGKGRFCIFSRHADKRATGAARIVVDEANQIFLPIEQLQLLADESALGDEANNLNELDNIRRANRVIRLSPPPSRHRTSPLSPKGENPELAPSVRQLRALAAGNAVSPAAG